MKIRLFILVLFFSSCGRARTNGSVTSGDERYQIKYETNDSMTDIHKNGCLMLMLYDNKGKLLNKIQTDVSTTSENWGIGWLHEQDTLILFNKETGLRLYKIDSNKILSAMKTTPELLKSADSIINRKY